jgi:hypothetical protein
LLNKLGTAAVEMTASNPFLKPIIPKMERAKDDKNAELRY